ncbi:MAG TPA: C39 family peptidase [Methylomirabilota bacterium]|nr:C39 family peptidase [Methylomirabilota bacterium]
MPRKISWKKISGLIVVAVVAAFLVNNYIHQKYPAPVSTPTNDNSVETPTVGSNPSPADSWPTSLLLPVPFTPQAPTANWDTLHNEACEEASAIMASEYFKGNRQITLAPSFVEDQISLLTKWQDDNFGYHLDTTSAETAEMIEKVYGLKTKLIENFTQDQLKDELNKKHVILISEYGRALNNPNYKSPGPIHHMLVVRGYTKNNFVTNDSGTRNGLNYAYSFNTLYSAAADWDQQTQNVDQSKKIAIIVSE